METKDLKIQVPEGYEVHPKKYRKDLLLKDLCARLPYGVFVKDTYNGHDGRMYKITQGCVYYVSEVNCNHLQSHPRYIKPYLRPMSSMTDEERSELPEHGFDADCEGYIKNGWMYSDAEKCNFEINIDDIMWLICWLNEHHFDYRGLIEKGLALDAKEGMYN